MCGRSTGLKLKLNELDGERSHDSHGLVATDRGFAERTQRLPGTLANISEWMRNQLRSDRLTEHLSDVHQLTEKWPRLSLLIPTFPPLLSSPFSSTFALFTRSVISCQPVHLSIPLPCSPCSVGLALTSRVVSTLILGCWLWKRSISASGCIRQPEWYVSVAMVTGCLYRMLISNHVRCFDRAVAMGFEEMVSGTLHSCLKNFWRIHFRALEDKAFCTASYRCVRH